MTASTARYGFVDSSAFRQRAVRVQLSDDPDTATQQTVQEMCRQVHQAAKDPLVQASARNSVQTFKGGPLWATKAGAPADPFASAQLMAESCWWWCKHYLRFKHHGAMFEMWSGDLGDPRTKLQLLISPDVLVRMAHWEGDCAIYTMMLAAMLEALGLGWEICTAAVDRRDPAIFGHVWPRAILENGSREPLDASHGKHPGWQVPDHDLHRLWVFDANGNRVQSRDSAGRFTGLHAYRIAYGGMGDVCFPGDPDYNPDACSGLTTVPGSSVDLTKLYPLGTTTGGAAPPYTAPSQSSAQWASFASDLLKQGFTLAQINAIQPGTVVTAGGILRQNPGYAVGSPTAAANLGISSNTLMIGGLAVVGIGLLMMMGRR